MGAKKERKSERGLAQTERDCSPASQGTARDPQALTTQGTWIPGWWVLWLGQDCWCHKNRRVGTPHAVACHDGTSAPLNLECRLLEKSILSAVSGRLFSFFHLFPSFFLFFFPDISFVCSFFLCSSRVFPLYHLASLST